jgi:hypothetical protein
LCCFSCVESPRDKTDDAGRREALMAALADQGRKAIAHPVDGLEAAGRQVSAP